MATKLQDALDRYGRAVDDLRDIERRIAVLPGTVGKAVVEEHQRKFEQARQHVDVCREEVERQKAVADARRLIPPAGSDVVGIRVGREEPVYRPDVRGVSFFRDVVNSRQDPMAMERLQRHQAATLDVLRETRDVTTGDPGAAGFVPPIYLGDMWAELPRASRPFLDILPKMPLPDVGMTVSVPKVQSGATTAVQAAQAGAVSETDIDTQSVTAPLVTIAGMNDVSLQALERTFPGLDFIIFQDLMADHDEQLDTQCLAGTGASGQHLGIRAVSGINTVTYTDATPTGAELLPKIYNAIERIGTLRFRQADAIIMHPRRAAWLGKELSSTFPLFQQGQLTQAVGQQEGGFVESFGGLRVVIDANISTEYGASTDEDEIYVVHSPDLILMEGPMQFVRFDDVLSGTLQVRLRLHSFSFFVAGRQPAAITKLSGTGCKSPTF